MTDQVGKALPSGVKLVITHRSGGEADPIHHVDHRPALGVVLVVEGITGLIVSS